MRLKLINAFCATVFFVLLGSGEYLAQTVTAVETIESDKSLVNQILVGKNLPVPEVRGDYYLLDEWSEGDIQLENRKMLKNQQMNYNLRSGNIEIIYKEAIRVVDLSLIHSFYLHDRTFLKAKVLNLPKEVDGYFELIEDGDLMLLCKHFVEIRQPTYVPGLAVGDRNYKVLKKKTYFIWHNAKLEPVKKSRKANTHFFSRSPKTVAFISKNKLHLNKIEDFVKAVGFFNALNHHQDER